MSKLLSIFLLFCAGGTWGQATPVPSPFEGTAPVVPATPLDQLMKASLAERGLEPAPLCSDAVFARRVYLDVTGGLPAAGEVRSFLDAPAATKRAELIDRLLGSDDHAVYWTMKWCDLLRVKAEFPINLWPNAVQAYHRWIYDAVRENRSYDTFSRELLTSNGSNFRVAPVNFYRAIQGQEPGDLARAVALTFMGTRLEGWSHEDRAGLEVFFSRVAFKKTAEWKEEIVSLDPAPAGAWTGSFPDGTRVEGTADEDPRVRFADWLVDPKNPWFARAAVNRTWSWLLGRGLVHEPDDIRPDNPPVHPEVLDYLAAELVGSGYDLRHVTRLILTSRTYQQSSLPQGNQPEAEALFARYPMRLLDAEVLSDALCQLTGTTESYSSEIPEPFTYVPEQQRSIALADGSISSPFLELFGRPSRDTGLASERSHQPTDAQRLHMLNSSHIQRKIEQGPRLRALIKNTGWRSPAVIQQLYLHILSRPPTQSETDIATSYLQTKGMNKKQGIDDLVWALINSKEFMYRH